MNTTNKNLLQNNNILYLNNGTHPHFQTVRTGKKSKTINELTVMNQTMDSDVSKNISLYGAYKFPPVRRSKTSMPDQARPQVFYESFKSSFALSSNSTEPVLSLLKNVTSGNNSSSVNKFSSTSESDHFFSLTPKNNILHTPVYATDVGRKLSKTTTSSSGASPFFKTPSKRSSGRTPKSTSSTVVDTSSLVIAITEGRGQARGEVGIAAMDIKRPHLILCQISDTQTYANTLRKINILNPMEILVPNTFCDMLNFSRLYQMINEQFPNTNIITVQRKFFNDSQGLQQIKHICLPDYSSVLPIILRKFYSLAAAAAILKYAEFEQNIIFAPKSIRVDYESGDNTAFIDLDTALRLELVMNQNLGTTSTQNTLYGILNHCCTLEGQRRLRALILQPPSDEINICKRLDCVQELIECPESFFALKSVLPKFWDVGQLLGLCMQIAKLKDNNKAAELQINYALLLKTSLEALPALKKALMNRKTEFFRNFLACLNNEQYNKILEKIYETLNDDAHLSKKFDINLFQRCFCIKTGINAFLDIARLAYSELVQDFNEVVEDLTNEYNLPLYIRTLRSKGPVLQMKLNKINSNFNLNSLPPIFIQVQRTRSIVTMTTKELMFLKERMNHFVQEIQLLSSVVIFEMLQEIRGYIGSLYILCENIAELDVIVSFAQTGKCFTFVRPQFSPNSMTVKSSVHPILHRISLSKPIPNDVCASIDKNVFIITGPNMGGKSIYIRQVALLQIMAQIGCYVPAESAQFRITDRIFSRMNFNDSIECNASSFVVELKEMQYIMKSLTPRSLIIIDELCRGTSTEEGTALAWAILEELLATNAFIFFTTHFWYLTKLQDLYCNVLNYHFEALEVYSDDSTLPYLIYTHRLLPGVIKLDHYGLKLAKSTAIPERVLKVTEEIACKLNAEWKATSISDNMLKEDHVIDNIILKMLEMVDNNTLTFSSVQEIVRHVKELNLSLFRENVSASTTVQNNESEISEQVPSTELERNFNIKSLLSAENSRVIENGNHNFEMNNSQGSDLYSQRITSFSENLNKQYSFASINETSDSESDFESDYIDEKENYNISGSSSDNKITYSLIHDETEFRMYDVNTGKKEFLTSTTLQSPNKQQNNEKDSNSQIDKVLYDTPHRNVRPNNNLFLYSNRPTREHYFNPIKTVENLENARVLHSL